MKTATTKGVQVSVKTWFRDDLSHVNEQQYFFNYRVFILNQNDYDIQLCFRDWLILDSFSMPKQISGEGVVGELPILSKNEAYDYISGCELRSDIGLMKGFYTFRNLQTGDNFRVVIPPFSLVFPARLN